MNEREQPAVIVAPDGRPARAAVSDACPRCGKGSEHRRADRGFGQAQPMCGACGYVFEGERWNG